MVAFLSALASTESETMRSDDRSTVQEKILPHTSGSTSVLGETARPAEQQDNRNSKQTAEISLPQKMKLALDRRFPGWKYAEVWEEIRRFLKEEISPFARPDIISGDFNGDARADYAVLIEQKSSVRKLSEAGARKFYLVVFLKRRMGSQMHILEPEGEYLTLIRRGARDYNYEKQSHFTYQNDAIFNGIFEKAGTSYIYRKGKFRAVLTSD